MIAIMSKPMLKNLKVTYLHKSHIWVTIGFSEIGTPVHYFFQKNKILRKYPLFYPYHLFKT